MMARDGLGARSKSILAWGAVALALAGAAGVGAVAVIVYTRRFDLLVPRDQFFGDHLPREVAQEFARRAIDKTTTIASVVAGSAVVLAVAALVRRRREPSSTPPPWALAVVSIVLGLSALPAALYVRVVADFYLTPWAFG